MYIQSQPAVQAGGGGAVVVVLQSQLVVVVPLGAGVVVQAALYVVGCNT